MTSNIRLATALSALLALASPVLAQPGTDSGAPPPATPTTEAATPVPPADPAAAAAAAAAKDSWTKGRPITMQYFRPQDKRGLNVYETTKIPGVEFTGFKLDFQAGFTSQVQSLSHSNTATPVIVNGVNTNQLADIGFGFNNSTANFGLNAQLAPGIRVALTSYLSSRHHNETWVKDGYLQMDESPIDWVPLKALMQIMTIRVGHFEINYGDAHFRRSDNGNAIYNPFVGNYIMDAFTTEIGGEVYLKAKSVIAMGSITAGDLRGTVLTPEQRGPSYIGKLGFDRQMNKDLRVRLTGSMYLSPKGMSNTLYGGDRAGSRFYYVMENTLATESAQPWSGLINPGFKNKVNAMQINPFVKYHGLELFGVLEQAKGQASTEPSERTWRQHAVDGVYRFLGDEKLFAGARYNRVTGELLGVTERRRSDALRTEWRLVHHAERDGQGRISQADVLGLSREQHQARREVRRLHARRRHRLLAEQDRGHPPTRSSSHGRRTHLRPPAAFRCSDPRLRRRPRCCHRPRAGRDRPRGGWHLPRRRHLPRVAAGGDCPRGPHRLRTHPALHARRPHQHGARAHRHRTDRRAGSHGPDDDVLEAHSPRPRCRGGRRHDSIPRSLWPELRPV